MGRWEPNPQVEQAALRLAAHVGYHGILDLDFRRDEPSGSFHLLDFNPPAGCAVPALHRPGGLDVVRAQYLDLTGCPGPRMRGGPGRGFLAENYTVLSHCWPPGGRPWPFGPAPLSARGWTRADRVRLVCGGRYGSLSDHDGGVVRQGPASGSRPDARTGRARRRCGGPPAGWPPGRRQLPPASRQSAGSPVRHSPTKYSPMRRTMTRKSEDRTMYDLAVVGAGPYGLSIASHATAAGLRTRVLGRPMAAWRDHMPQGMFLKSEPSSSNLSDPAGRHTLDAYCAARELRTGHGNPLAIGTFTEYGLWFAERAAPPVDDARRHPGGARAGGIPGGDRRGRAFLHPHRGRRGRGAAVHPSARCAEVPSRRTLHPQQRPPGPEPLPRPGCHGGGRGPGRAGDRSAARRAGRAAQAARPGRPPQLELPAAAAAPRPAALLP